jgi:ubiquitin C-terminal hydrolase
VITLKRFYWNFEQMNRIKINDYFEFPLELDLSGFAMQGRKETDPHYFDYKLCGIIIHSGSAESGHYYSFIKVGERWL